MIGFRKVLGLLFLGVASWYVFSAGLSLLTYPSDLTVLGGIVMLGLLGMFWLELGVITIKHVINHFKGEK